jgi:hypothetical protein
MGTLRISVAVLVLAIAIACAPRSRPVRLEAGAGDREALAGAWRGGYTIDYRRSGTLSFALVAGEDDARGEVLMIPRGAERPYGVPPWIERPRVLGGPVVATEILSIRFVHASGGRVEGTLVPYWDPDRSCVASATFAGRLDRDTLAGTFVSTCDRGVPTWTGRWSMRRVR